MRFKVGDLVKHDSWICNNGKEYADGYGIVISISPEWDGYYQVLWFCIKYFDGSFLIQEVLNSKKTDLIKVE